VGPITATTTVAGSAASLVSVTSPAKVAVAPAVIDVSPAATSPAVTRTKSATFVGIVTEPFVARVARTRSTSRTALPGTNVETSLPGSMVLVDRLAAPVSSAAMSTDEPPAW